jgi:quercetin dioxygenase-like cupin family protein
MITNQRTPGGMPCVGAPIPATTLLYQGRPIAILLSAEQTTGQCSITLSIERPGSEPPRHCHQHEDETCYVLAGTLTYHVGDEMLTATAGSCIFLPRGVEHAFVVHSSEAQVLTLYTPGGFEGYLREMSTAHPSAPDATREVERMIAVAARYGCDITGPAPVTSAE